MIDLGKKMSAGIEKPSKNEKSYPSMTLTQKQMPCLKGMDIDDECMMMVKAKIKSINKYGDGDVTYGMDMMSAEEHDVQG